MRRKVLLLVPLLSVGLVSPSAADDLPVPGPIPSVSPPVPSIAPPTGFERSEQQCTVTGTSGPDRLIGTTGPDHLCGLGGDDVLEGLEGDDVLDGGDGVDTATWESASCCVRANLEARIATGGLGTDQLLGIENLTGTQGTDVIRGDTGPNTIAGLGATDLLFGGDGDDWLVGGEGDDWLAGEGGANVVDGGTGSNLCAGAPGISCDASDPADPADVRGPLDVALVDAPEGGDTSWRIGLRGRVSPVRLWDEGYVVISFDTRGGEEFDVHALVRWDRRRTVGLLISEGERRASGRFSAKRAGRRGLLLRLPLGSLGLDPARLYYRWSARTIFTGPGCRPCFDTVPDTRAYPQPLVSA